MKMLRGAAPRADQGMVTLEMALAAPLLAGVTAALVSLSLLVVEQAELVDGARAIARAVARSDIQAVQTARSGLSEAARVSVVTEGGSARVDVRRTFHLPIALMGDRGIELRAESWAPLEPSDRADG